MENTQRLELKIIALREGFKNKVASLADEYEDRIADLRIELTEQNQNLSNVMTENDALRQKIEELGRVEDGEKSQEETSDEVA